MEPRPPLEATLVDANRRQKEALLRAVLAGADRWPDVDRTVAAALFDVLWSVETYERLVGDWQIEPTEAIRGVSWIIGLLEQAVRDGRGPS